MIYSAYHVTCHEWPFRAYFLFGPQATYSLAELEARGVNAVFDFRGSAELGYKVAFCERNVAIYTAALLAGLLYARLGRRLPALSFSGYLLLLTPMALDGFSQLGGWRESTWELRTLTGLLFVLCVPLCLIGNNVRWVALSPDTYREGFARYRAAERTGLDPDQLSGVARAFIDYFQAPPGRLNPTVTVGGGRRPLFNEREVAHMEDVQKLMRLVFRLGVLSALYAVVFAAG